MAIAAKAAQRQLKVLLSLLTTSLKPFFFFPTEACKFLQLFADRGKRVLDARVTRGPPGQTLCNTPAGLAGESKWERAASGQT